jgi:hypothetical protein
MIRWLAALLVVVVIVYEFLAWRRTLAPSSPAPAPQVQGLPDSIVTRAPGDPGVRWVPPGTWAKGPERPMRLATYLPPAGGGRAAECAVFFFGEGAGGGVDDNVDRWVAQFVGSPNPVRTRLRTSGLDVTRVSIAGTFLDPGSDMRSQGQQQDWMVLGAIVTGPRGPVFFKMTGPEAAVRAAADDFDAMLMTLAPSP